MTARDASGATSTSFARFHAILRKEGEVWRIFTDSRRGTSPQADAEAFAAAHEPESLISLR